MSGWENFLLAEVGAAATLAGLIFVGVSLNLTKILATARLRGRAFEALLLLVTILIVASLLLVPDLALAVYGAELLVAGIVVWAACTRMDLRIWRATEPAYRRVFLFNMFLTQLATLPYIITAISLLTVGASGLYGLVPVVIFSFIKAVLVAWVLLVEINR